MANKPSKTKGGVDNAAVNRIIRLERTLKTQPNNKDVIMALKNTRAHRKTPFKPFWSHSMIYTAKLFKAFNGWVNIDMFKERIKGSVAVPLTKGVRVSTKMVPESKGMYHLGLRATDSIGVRVWK